MPSIFTRIVQGEIPCYKVAEDDAYLAFLDISPLAKGHVLVIPKQEVDYIFDMDSAHYQGLWAFAQRVSRAVKAAVPCTRIGVAVIGLEVPHAHIHLIPMNRVSDMNFANPKLSLPKEEMEAVCAAIRSHWV